MTQALDPDQTKARWPWQSLARLRQLGNVKARGWRRHHGQAGALQVLVKVGMATHQQAHIGVDAERTV